MINIELFLIILKFGDKIMVKRYKNFKVGNDATTCEVTK